MLILDLPPEIISLILVRLPVNTLSILKCVCTYFSRFISCQHFIREHLKFSTEDASVSNYKVMFQGLSLTSQLMKTSVHSFCHDSPVNFVCLDFPGKELARESIRLVGSCNGLVLSIINEKHLFVWNPTIRKHEKLPSIVGRENLDNGLYTRPRFYCGFGFDASNFDYKVVVLFAYRCLGFTSKTDVSYEVNVFSFKRNSWIRVPDFTAGEFTVYSGTFASGKLHWCTNEGDVVYFDVEKEVFRTLERPNYAEGFLLGFFILSVLDGSVAVCTYYYRHAEVWVMKEYGMVVSWTKMFTLSDHSEVSPEPFYIFPNGKLLTGEGVFHIYNPIDNSWRSTNIGYYNDPVFYIESLVSPCCN